MLKPFVVAISLLLICPATILGQAGQMPTDDTADRLVRDLAADPAYGLILFHRPGCGHCTAQLAVFMEFVRETNWKPVRISEVDQNPAAAARFGVETVPEIWLVMENGGASCVAMGNVTLDRIHAHIFAAYRDLR